MKRILVMFMFILAASGCAEKQEVFDPAAVFSSAEQNMRKGSFEKARKEYQEIQEKAENRSYDPVLMLRIADTYYGEEKYDEARVEYQAFLNYHPANRDAAYAQYQTAMCSFKQMSTIDRDPEAALTAIREFEALIGKHPGSVYESQARENVRISRDHLAQYELYVARFYHKKGSFASAADRLETLLRDYPDSSIEKDALYYAGLTYIEMGKTAEASRSFEILLGKYPDMQESVKPLLDNLKTR